MSCWSQLMQDGPITARLSIAQILHRLQLPRHASDLVRVIHGRLRSEGAGSDRAVSSRKRRTIRSFRSREISKEMKDKNLNSSPDKHEVRLTEAQKILTSSPTNGFTVHLEMNIVGNVKSLLEEVAQLKRLGNFNVAEQFSKLIFKVFAIYHQ
jgi:hypothetical protein